MSTKSVNTTQDAVTEITASVPVDLPKETVTLFSKVDYEIQVAYGSDHVFLPPRGKLQGLDKDKLDLSSIKPGTTVHKVGD